MAVDEQEGELTVGGDLSRVGVRRIEPCDCGGEDCVRQGRVIEIATIAQPELAQGIAETYIEHGEGHPIAFPVFITADDARALADRLTKIADEVDPRTKH